MGIRIVEEVNSAGSGTTGDRIWHGNDAVAIFDGAADLRPGGVGSGWLIDRFVEALPPVPVGGYDLLDAVNDAIAHVAEEYSRVLASDDEGCDRPMPFASMAILTLCDGSVSVISVGDCLCCLFSDGGGVVRCDDMVRRVDDRVVQAAAGMAEERGIPFAEALASDEVRAMLAHVHRMANADGGYAVLAPNLGALPKSAVVTLPASVFRRAVMMTDGFTWVADDIISGSREVADALSDLRRAEEADPLMEVRPRLIASDDAALVRLEFD